MNIEMMKRSLYQYPHVIRILKKYFYPKELYIFLTTRCNIRCIICRREGYEANDLDIKHVYKLKKPIKYASIVDVTGWGECFLYPKFAEVLTYILSVSNNKRIIRIITNGTLLSKSYAELLSGRIAALTISLNAATAETYNRDMRYGNFEKTIAGIREFMAHLGEEDTSRVSLSFVAHAQNYHELPGFVKLGNSLNIKNVGINNYRVGTVDHINMTLLNVKDRYNNAVEEAEALARELGVNFSARKFDYEEPSSSEECTDPFNICIVRVDGKIGSPCCFAAHDFMQEDEDSSFDDVWFGKKYTSLRKKRNLKSCQHCVRFIAFDDPRAHFDSHFKQTKEFAEILPDLARSALLPRERPAFETEGASIQQCDANSNSHAECEAVINSLQQRIFLLETSLSWRLTKPLRWLGDKLHRQ